MLGLTFVSGEPIPHLFFVISKESKGGRVLIVNITDIKNTIKSCDSCILDKGDHPFIIKPSKALYSFAITPLVSDLKSLIKTDPSIQRPDAEYATILKLQEGAKISPIFKPDYKVYFQYF
ncbi:hypothetical protein CH370_14550 [Leptospira kmetyi]|uniref:hypothetical protein n=1 Tax=Leptospira kmetyi TaxID=408139 RepID=UPI000C2A7F7F|nr:hypothetical protein [Leptospira kmetyi]PJZ40957.1 hypothetical protein CH370_14550 [Leptospira kmetyi]